MFIQQKIKFSIEFEESTATISRNPVFQQFSKQFLIQKFNKRSSFKIRPLTQSHVIT